jgi:hypothetical protein
LRWVRATEDEIRDERPRFPVGQVVPTVVCDEFRGDVIAGRVTLRAQQFIEVRGELDRRQLSARSTLRAHEEERVDESECPHRDAIGVIGRDADDTTRGSCGERKCEPRPKLDLACSGQPVCERRRELFDFGAVVLDCSRGELPCDRAPHPLVILTILAEHQQRPHVVQRPVSDARHLQGRHGNRSEPRVVQQSLDVFLTTEPDDDSQLVGEQVARLRQHALAPFGRRHAERKRRLFHRNDKRLTHARTLLRDESKLEIEPLSVRP